MTPFNTMAMLDVLLRKMELFRKLGIGILVIVSAVTVWFLIWRTELLLNIMGIKDNGTQMPWSCNETLGVGVKLVGLYTLTQSIPSLRL